MIIYAIWKNHPITNNRILGGRRECSSCGVPFCEDFYFRGEELSQDCVNNSKREEKEKELSRKEGMLVSS